MAAHKAGGFDAVRLVVGGGPDGHLLGTAAKQPHEGSAGNAKAALAYLSSGSFWIS